MQARKKSIIAILAGVVVAGALSASAATLGGAHWAQLGGDTAAVAAPVTNADGAPLGEYTSTDGGKTWSKPEAAITAHDVEGIAVVINGTKVAS